MKGILVKKFGGPEVMAYEDLDDPKPQADEVLIRVHRTGVNFADVKARTNVHHIKRPLPFIPGLDTTGTIEAIGSAVKKLKVGQRVVAFPRGGSYCEAALAHELLTFPIPATIDDDTAAAFPVVAGTSYAMLALIAGLQAGQGLLLHSAGGGAPSAILDLTPEEWHYAFDVHVHASYYLCRAVAPLLIEKQEGAIVLVSSVAGIRGVKFALAYGTVKGAVAQFTRMLAYQLADHNVRVNCVAPGIIRTAFHDGMSPEAYQHNVDNRIPLHREGTAAQVADGILELVRNEYITGEMLVIDGGLTSRIA